MTWDDLCVIEWRVMSFPCYREPWKKARFVEQDHEMSSGLIETFQNIPFGTVPWSSLLFARWDSARFMTAA